MKAVKGCSVMQVAKSIGKNALLQRKRFIMRKQAYTMIAVVVLLGCLSVSANAQCGGIALIAKIPFQFSTGKATLPAGEYLVKCLDANRSQLVFQSTAGKAAVIMPMILVSGRAQRGTRLVFHRYGHRYFFVQAWAGGSNGLELPTTRAEDAAARELAGIEPQRETIALTAHR
jgi:hypothetical protein